MIAFVLLGLLAGAQAAPTQGLILSPYGFDSIFGDGDVVSSSFITSISSSIGDDSTDQTSVSQTGSFWQALAQQMKMLEDTMKKMDSGAPQSVNLMSGKVDSKGNQYIVTIPLSGFEKKDINVKVADGILTVKASQNKSGMSQYDYVDMRSVPSFVDADKMTWNYEKNVLTVTFPVIRKPINGDNTQMTKKDDKEATKDETETKKEEKEPKKEEKEPKKEEKEPKKDEKESPKKDREELEPVKDKDSKQDADVGVRGDVDNKQAEEAENEVTPSKYEKNHKIPVEP